MSDETDDDRDEEEVERTETGRKRRSDAGRPRGSSSSGGRKQPARVEKRAQKTAQTIEELIKLRRSDLDDDDLGLVETVKRDAKKLGEVVAQICELVPPLGVFVDLVFGTPVMLLVNLAPTVRAARRDYRDRRERRRAEAEAAAESEGGELPADDARHGLAEVH